MGRTTQEDDAQTATVSEDKFNGTATLMVKAENRNQAEMAARKFFEDKHGSKPSKVIVDDDVTGLFSSDGRTNYEVMVADHSSGSLINSENYEF